MDDYPLHPTGPPRSTRPWCLFHAGASSYAVGLESVAEVVEVERLVRLPHSPPRILGLCTLRREVIPVIGLDPIPLKGETPTTGSGTKVTVLILKSGRGPWAFRVNAEGTSVAEEALGDPTPVGSDRRPSGLALTGSVRRGETVYSVIDPDATWKQIRDHVEEWYGNLWGPDTTSERARVAAGLTKTQETLP